MPVALAHEEKPRQVQYLDLTNNGAYRLAAVTLKWKDGHGVEAKTWSANVDSRHTFCVDLTKVSNIAEGAEVWLVADIDGGTRESCRKDTKRYFSSNGKRLHHKMSGTTYNDNRCRTTGAAPAKDSITSGNSTACGTAGF